MKKMFCLAVIMAATMGAFTGCGNSNVSYKDGTYEGKSSVYEAEDGSTDGNGYGVVNITISGGKISDCTYKTYEVDGTLKDEKYGMEGGRIANKDFYNKAQKANAACQEYANMLVANGQTDGIDAISGATINYNEFVEAVDNALEGAKQ